jgi:hypothetical protein
MKPVTRPGVLVAIALIGACTGDIGSGHGFSSSSTNGGGGGGDTPGSTPGMGPGGGTSTTTPGQPGTMAMACKTPDPGRSPLRRLNRVEWNNTIRDLIGDTRALANKFVLDESGGGFSNNADALLVTNLGAYQFEEAAEAVAQMAVTRLSSWMPCDAAKTGEAACAQQFVTTFGRRAFRRPLASDEVGRYMALYTAGRADGGFADGVELALEAFLQSPHFLYRVETGVPAQKVGNALPLTSYEMATRLSYFLWGTMPDDPLFQAAADNKLTTVAGVEAQARRMMMDPRAHQMVATFHDEWLDVGAIEGLAKTSTSWTSAVKTAMRTEAATFVDQVFWSDGHLPTFFSATYSYVNADLAKLYGMTPPAGTTFVKTDTNPQQRAGLVTLGGLLALHSYPDQSSPIHRGKFVREQLLCQPLPSPPNNIDGKPVVIMPPKVDPSASTRQRFAQHEAEPICASCHKLMDPIGLAFENYDPIGRWRDKDGTFPVDATGEITGTDFDGTFNGAVELAHKLQGSKLATTCIARQWFKYANGRVEVDGDACSLAALAARMQATNQDLRELLVAISTSDAFRYRSPTGGGQ